MEIRDFFEEDVARGTMRAMENVCEKTGIYSFWECDPELLEEVALFIWHGPSYFLEMVTAVDQIDTGKMVGVYTFNRFDGNRRIVIHVPVSRNMPRLPSISMIFPGAVWHERETSEFFGITYIDLIDPRNLLLAEDSDEHPLRKDYEGVQ